MASSQAPSSTLLKILRDSSAAIGFTDVVTLSEELYRLIDGTSDANPKNTHKRAWSLLKRLRKAINNADNIMSKDSRLSFSPPSPVPPNGVAGTGGASISTDHNGTPPRQSVDTSLFRCPKGIRCFTSSSRTPNTCVSGFISLT